jgi:2-isopropylmalate synthase
VIKILDSTLREGEQTPGVYFDLHIKLAIADLLDDIGIDIIESGHPAVTGEIMHAVEQISHRNMNALVGAHSRSLKQDIDQALACGVGFLGIFYCVSEERLENVFKKPIHKAIDLITESISYARQERPDLMIRYTPEDTVRSRFENVISASAAAVEAGADIISVADTTGFMVPGTVHNMYDFISRLREELDRRGHNPVIAVHCHNDRGLALANALDGIRAGAGIVDASVLGIGERAGIVDLAQLLIAVQDDAVNPATYRSEKLMELYALVSRYANLPVPVNFPITGKNAFTHCAGVHTHAAIKNPVHYQSVDPGRINRNMEVSLDHMSGISSVAWALDKIGLEAEKELLPEILNVVKNIGQKGRTVDFTELAHIVEWCKHKETNNENRIPAFSDS